MRAVFFIMLLSWATAVPASEFTSELESWRQKRLEALVREESWTSLVGLYWLDPAAVIRVGGRDDNDVVIAGLPDFFGEIRRDAGRWRLRPVPGGETSHAGHGSGDDTLLFDENAVDPAGSAQKIVAGRIRFVLIERSGRIGMRVWDTQAGMRTAFPGIDAYPGDPDWRIDARWQPHEPTRTIDIATVIGTVEPILNPGAAVFERDGKTYTLEALLEEGSDELFFIFADRTSGKATYGAGRYLYAPMAADGRVTLDFNRAFNPPCAFSEFATCPLPPPENRLDLAVGAGELSFAKPH